MAIRIITDSTSDIPNNILESLNIEVVSLYVTFGEESFKSQHFKNEEFYIKMEKEGIPVSSQPSVGDMMEAMEKIVKVGDDVICVLISSGLSGTYQNAMLSKDLIKKDYPNANIAVIDSGSVSMELGFAAIKGANLAKAGSDFDTVVKEIEETIKYTRFIFLPDNLDYLHKGGRIGGAGKLFGNMLKITPILTIIDNKIEIFQTVRTKSRAKKVMVDKLMEDHEKYGVEEVVIHHINSYQEAREIKDNLDDILMAKISIQDIGPVIGLHVGPGSVGLAYRTNKVIAD